MCFLHFFLFQRGKNNQERLDSCKVTFTSRTGNQSGITVYFLSSHRARFVWALYFYKSKCFKNETKTLPLENHCLKVGLETFLHLPRPFSKLPKYLKVSLKLPERLPPPPFFIALLFFESSSLAHPSHHSSTHKTPNSVSFC